MAEVYPSDNELLNIQSDAETGVEFIPTGLAPYYLQFRKLLYRFLLAAKRGNDFRVYDEGGLDIGVKGGQFWLGTQLIQYEGSAGNELADNKESIYVYFDSDGSLVTNEYNSFPNMVDEAHIRLAVITTSNGDIASISDCRGSHTFAIPSGAGGTKRAFIEHDSDNVLTAAESGSVHSNLDASGTITLTLPEQPPAGTYFSFAVQAAQSLRIEPGAATIRDDSGQGSGKYKSANTVGSCITLMADSYGDWATIGKNGTWTEEA